MFFSLIQSNQMQAAITGFTVKSNLTLRDYFVSLPNHIQ